MQTCANRNTCLGMHVYFKASFSDSNIFMALMHSVCKKKSGFCFMILMLYSWTVGAPYCTKYQLLHNVALNSPFTVDCLHISHPNHVQITSAFLLPYCENLFHCFPSTPALLRPTSWSAGLFFLNM